MNIELIRLIAFTIIVGGICYAAGLLFLTAWRIKLTSIHYVVSPVLGLALLALQLWVYGLLGVSWKRWTLIVPWLILLVILRKRSRKSLFKPKVFRTILNNFRAMDLLGKTLLVLCIVFSLAFVVSLALEPIITSDILAIWGYKAKDFFFHQQVFVSPHLDANINSARFYHVDYPPLLPLMADVFYVLLGHINEGLFKSLQSLFIFSGASALFIYIKNRSSDKKEGLQIAAISTFILIAAPQFIPMLFKQQYMGYADYPLAILMLISVIFLARFIKSESSHDWWLSLGFASLAGVIKNEGIAFLGIMILVLFALRILPLSKDRLKANYGGIAIVAIGSLLIVVPSLLWTRFKQKHGLVVDFKFSNLSDSGMSLFGRIHTILDYIWIYITTNPAFHWESIALVLATIYVLLKRSKASLIIAAIIWAQIFSYIVSFVFSPYDLKFHVLSSIDRLLTQVLPLIILLLAVCLTSTSTTGKNRRHTTNQ